ncbi:MAG TPA: hypothetical protein PLY95_00060 [Candidatus Paceibacterota bacterium]|nr:hypothetical protein [Candidatus Paceibacterota bacterium]HQI25639.1 hypothetical protein [Candidatus Paceibacterota bacterium]HQJ83611.1 hypothetical protein [Candidatus Paceibacterota bacterium]
MENEEKKLNKMFAVLRQVSRPRPELLRRILADLNKPVSSPFFFTDFIKRRSFLSFSVMTMAVLFLVVFGQNLGPAGDPFADSQSVHAQIIREVDKVIESGFAGELEILAAEDALAAEIGTDDFLQDLNSLENELLLP